MFLGCFSFLFSSVSFLVGTFHVLSFSLHYPQDPPPHPPFFLIIGIFCFIDKFFLCYISGCTGRSFKKNFFMESASYIYLKTENISVFFYAPKGNVPIFLKKFLNTVPLIFPTIFRASCATEKKKNSLMFLVFIFTKESMIKKSIFPKWNCPTAPQNPHPQSKIFHPAQEILIPPPTNNKMLVVSFIF